MNTLLTSMAEKKYYHCIRPSGVSLTRKPASQQRNTIKKCRRSDPIRCLVVMKLARLPSHRRHETVIPRYLCYTDVSRKHISYEIYAVEVCSQSQICLCGWINGSIKILSFKLHSTPNSALHFEFLYVVLFCGIRLSGQFGLSNLGISGNNSANKSFLQDQDKQLIHFFVLRFPVKYSDRVVATGCRAKSSRLPIPEGFGICQTL